MMKILDRVLLVAVAATIVTTIEAREVLGHLVGAQVRVLADWLDPRPPRSGFAASFDEQCKNTKGLIAVTRHELDEQQRMIRAVTDTLRKGYQPPPGGGLGPGRDDPQFVLFILFQSVENVRICLRGW